MTEDIPPIPSLRDQLRNMSERSLLFKLVKDEMKRRGHWKGHNRGSDIKKVLINGVNTQAITTPSVSYYDDSQFSE